MTMWLITVEALTRERLCGPQRSTNVLKLIPWEVVNFVEKILREVDDHKRVIVGWKVWDGNILTSTS